ncbi:DUF732 domain-containing protein [Streptomyces mutabilis]|uniref:DUF732 domain-containing protein n=1 Tax=Streptomyces mutabilis TaxID=67332 RepID=UPI00177E0742|nr:DUF732 domain-containing protein [Streptomyces mutabilis]GGQ29717.1 hypothetical protein GCM10010279_42230 [Streptomyces mutabilis]
MGKRSAIAVSALVAVAGVTTAVVYGGGGDGDGPDSVESVTVGGGEQHVIPSPDAGQRELLLSDLAAVDPVITADEDEAVENARWLCVDLRQDRPEDEVRDAAAQRFRVTWEQSAQVLDAVRGTFC